jgi:hypothetical protein
MEHALHPYYYKIKWSCGYVSVNIPMACLNIANACRSTDYDGIQWAGSVLQQVLNWLSLAVAFNVWVHVRFVSQVNEFMAESNFIGFVIWDFGTFYLGLLWWNVTVVFRIEYVFHWQYQFLNFFGTVSP